MEPRLTLVLVHGAFHGAWCWDKVLPLLDAGFMEVQAVELPLTSLADDIDAVTAVIEKARAPVLLCGHSYGGMVISGAGAHPRVKRLVYLTAVVPQPGQNMSEAALAGVHQLHAPEPDLADGALVYSAEHAQQTFYNDCSEEDAAFAASLLRPTGLGCFTEPVDRPAWKERPTTYVVCTQDGAIDPDVQRRMARDIADVREWGTGHSPFFSRPSLVGDLLRAQGAVLAHELAGEQVSWDGSAHQNLCGGIQV